MKTVHIQFFAAFREQAGVDEHCVQTDVQDAHALFAQLQSTFSGLERYTNMKFAVNDKMVAEDYALCDGDRVLFFPPVAGG